MKQYHFVYKTTNTLNGKIYVGKHSTNNIDDGYMGSGKALIRAIDKHGADVFTREIISYHDTPEQALLAEKDIVTMDFIARPDTYNMVVGGGGASGNQLSPESILSIKNKLKARYSDKSNHPMTGKKHTDEARLKMSESWNGREYNKDAVAKASDACRGTKFYNNGSISGRYIPGTEPEGWVPGRISYDNGHKGKVVSEDTRRKQSESSKGKTPKFYSEVVTCPHCGKSGQAANMKRWHFDNCGKPRKLAINNTTLICPHCDKVGTNVGSMKRHHFDNCKHRIRDES